MLLVWGFFIMRQPTMLCTDMVQMPLEKIPITYLHQEKLADHPVMKCFHIKLSDIGNITEEEFLKQRIKCRYAWVKPGIFMAACAMQYPVRKNSLCNILSSLSSGCKVSNMWKESKNRANVRNNIRKYMLAGMVINTAPDVYALTELGYKILNMDIFKGGTSCKTKPIEIE